MKWMISIGMLLLSNVPVVSVSAEATSNPFEPPAKQMSLAVIPDSNAHFLVEDIFIGSQCFEVSNASVQGTFQQIGQFTGGTTAINMEHGVMLSTGAISNALGPNDESNAETRFGTLNNDPDLSILSNGSSFQDVAILEFDFIPTVSNVSFEYVFASEEFCEYVNTDFNDMFGFFISGPGINGPFTNNAANIALVPQTDTYVSINTINHLLNSVYYVNNMPLSQGQACNSEEGEAIDHIQFDGFTKVLKASAEVIPCETYHIKVIVGDRGDDRYDSAVFLKGNSFSAGSTISAVAGVTSDSTNSVTTFEGCSDGYFLFERQSPNLNEDVVVHFSISDASTAQAGEDYIPFPDSVIIPAGDSTFQLPVTILEDNIPNETDVLILNLLESCNCEGASASLIINDLPPLQLSLPDLTVCEGTTVTLSPQITGGVPNFAYSWDNGSVDSTLSIPAPDGSISLNLSLTDDCGQEVSDEITITTATSNAVLSGAGIICDGHPEDSLNIELTGLAPFDLVYTLNGQADTLFNIQNSQFTLPVSQSGVYELTSISSYACPGSVSGQAEVITNEILLEAQAQPISCFGAEDGSINLDVSGGATPYTFQWNHTTENIENLNNLDTGFYEVLVRDQTGCIQTANANITEPAPILVDLVQIEHIDCETSSGILGVEAIGGTGNLSYQWNNTSANSTLTNLEAGPYALTVSDENDCQAFLDTLIENRIDFPLANIAPADTLDCDTDEVTLLAQSFRPDSVLSYQWMDPNGQNTFDTLSLAANIPGIYQFISINSFNHCRDTTIIEVVENRVVPLAIAGEDDSLTCAIEQLQLVGQNSSVGDEIQYAWTTQDGMISQGENSLTPIITAPGLYQLQVFNTLNACSSVDTVIITENRVYPDLQFIDPDTINCLQPEVSIQAMSSGDEANLTFSWQTSNGQIQGPTNLSSIVVDARGTYSLEIVNSANGCAQVDSIMVSADLQHPEVDAGPDLQLDCHTPSTQIQAEAFAGNGFEFSLSWNTLEGNAQLSPQSLSPTVDEMGIFELLITNEINGCQSRDTIVVSTFFEYPEINIQSPQPVTCRDSSIVLDATNSSQGSVYLYQWTSLNGNIQQGANSSTPVVDAEGSYQLKIIHQGSGCVDSAMVEVIEDFTVPEVNVETPAELNCTYLQTPLSATVSNGFNNLNYLWSSADGSISGPENAPNSWTNTPGQYTLLVTNNENGCTVSESVQVNQNVVYPNAFAGEDQQLNCAIVNLQLDGSSSSSGDNIDYFWYNADAPGNILSQANQLATNTAGDFVLEVINLENNCQTFDTVSISIDTITPIANAIQTDSLTCNETSLMLNGNGSSTGSNISYEWTSPLNLPIINPNSLSPIVSNPGAYELIVTNNENHCNAAVLVSIEIDTLPPIAEAGPSLELNCETTEALLDGTQSSSGNISYVWSSANGHIAAGANAVMPLIDEAGSYYLLVTDLGNGCQAVDSVVVSKNVDIPTIQLFPPSLLTCSNTTVSLIGNVEEDPANLVFQWTDEFGNPLPEGDSSSINVNEAGVYQLLAINPSNHCRDSASISVHEDIQMPIADAGSPGFLDCVDTNFTLDASASSNGEDFVYQWRNQSGLLLGITNQPQFTVSEPDVYQLIVEDTSNGCTSEAEVAVLLNVPENASIELSQPDCAGQLGSISISDVQNGTPPFLYSIDGGQNFNTQSNFYQLDAGEYALVIQDLNGCTFETEAHIEAAPDLELFLPETSSIRLGDTLHLKPQFSVAVDEIQSYFWRSNVPLSCSNCPYPSAIPQNTSSFHLSIITQDGCQAEAQMTVIVDKTQDIYIPNAFSPHRKDGINDIFYVFAEPQGIQQIIQMQVFNRWGGLVFQQKNFPPNDPQFGWDGTWQGHPKSSGVYVYFIEIERRDGQRLILKGEVTLMN